VYSKSLLEEFVETRHPDALTHKWVYVSSSDFSLLSGCRADSFEPIGMLDENILCGADWSDLSDANRKKLYEILRYASTNLTKTEKRGLYSALTNKVGRQFVDFIERYQVPHN